MEVALTYGSNQPTGLVPVRYQGGAPYEGATNEYLISSGYGTAIYTNDPVTLSGGYLAIGVAGSAILGTFQGCKYTTTGGIVTFSPYWPASTTVLTGTTVTALVADDPNLLFDVQETNASGAAGTALAQTNVGINLNFRVGTGSAATGLSGASINNASTATTATLNCKLIKLSPVVGNVVGSFANWLVLINNHILKGGTGTLGIS